MTTKVASWPAATADRGTARLGRSTVFGGSSVCLAYAAHVAAGGFHPPWVVVAVAVGLLVRVSYGLAGTERGPLALAVGLGASQLALHVAFAVATISPAAHVGGHHHAALLPAGAMTLTHAVAAAVTALLLRGAEHRTWDTARMPAQLRRAFETTRRELAGVAGRAWSWTGTAEAAVAAAAAVSIKGRRAATGPWLPAADTASWRPDVPLGRFSRRRGPPSAAVTTTNVVTTNVVTTNVVTTNIVASFA